MTTTCTHCSTTIATPTAKEAKANRNAWVFGVIVAEPALCVACHNDNIEAYRTWSKAQPKRVHTTRQIPATDWNMLVAAMGKASL